MANNNIFFNAAIAGGMGVIDERWVQSQTATAITNLKNNIVAFATALDAAIPASSVANEAQSRIVESLSAGFWAGRYATKTLSSDYTAEATALAAIYGSVKTALLAESSDVATLFFVVPDDDAIVNAESVKTHTLAVAGVLATDKVVGVSVPNAAGASGIVVVGTIPGAAQVNLNYINGTAAPTTNGPVNYIVFVARGLPPV